MNPLGTDPLYRKQLDLKLGLKYQSRMNWAVALQIMLGVFSFQASLIFLTQPQFAQVRYVGVIFTLMLMRLLFGSPTVRELTPESQQKLFRHVMDEVDAKVFQLEKLREDAHDE